MGISPCCWLFVLLPFPTAITSPKEIIQPNFCLKERENVTSHFLIYNDGTEHSVYIPYPAWGSAQVIANIAYILIKEVMNYSVVLIKTESISSEHPVNYAAGCVDPDDPNCTEHDAWDPKVHFTLETWEGGHQRATILNEDVRPDLLNVLSYTLIDSWYVPESVFKDGLHHNPPLSLDYYRSYDATYYDASRIFDKWEKLIQLLPKNNIVRCSSMTPGSAFPRHTDNYIAVTNDTDVECQHNDSVWFSPACRSNRSRCVPLLISYNFDVAMQLAFFHNLPLAIVMADGTSYYEVARAGRFLFGWYQPSDDPAADGNGNYPLLVNLPPADVQEQLRGVYRTGFAQFKPYNYCWRHLREVDRLVHSFAAQVDLGDQDWARLMPQSRRLKVRGPRPGPSCPACPRRACLQRGEGVNVCCSDRCPAVSAGDEVLDFA